MDYVYEKPVSLDKMTDIVNKLNFMPTSKLSFEFVDIPSPKNPEVDLTFFFFDLWERWDIYR